MQTDGEVQAQGRTFAYREWGSGPTVLLLHGFPDSPGTFVDLAQSLAAAGFRAVAPWMRGYGPTGGDEIASLGQLARDALGLAEAFEPDSPIAIIGHDWGAVAACMAATLRPDRLSRLVMLGLPHPAHFLNTIFGDSDQLRRSWYIWLFQLPGLPEASLAANDYEAVKRLWADWSPGLGRPPHWEEIVAAFDAAGLEGPLSYYRALFADQAGDDPDDGALYGPVQTPTLALMGEHDGCISPSYLSRQEHYWEAPLRMEVVKDCGHFLHMEQASVVGRMVTDFLTTQPDLDARVLA